MINKHRSTCYLLTSRIRIPSLVTKISFHFNLTTSQVHFFLKLPKTKEETNQESKIILQIRIEEKYCKNVVKSNVCHHLRDESAAGDDIWHGILHKIEAAVSSAEDIIVDL